MKSTGPGACADKIVPAACVGKRHALRRRPTPPGRRRTGGPPQRTALPHYRRITRCHNMLTARAASKATVVKDMMDCTIIMPLAQRDSTGTSVGENAVLVLNARNR